MACVVPVVRKCTHCHLQVSGLWALSVCHCLVTVKSNVALQGKGPCPHGWFVFASQRECTCGVAVLCRSQSLKSQGLEVFLL